MDMLPGQSTNTRSVVTDSPLARAAKELGILSSVVLLTALCAQVRIPLPYTTVPMTLQWPVVLLAGLMLTPGRAVSAMLLYLAVGTLGWPVFTPLSLGLFGETAGYLVGFVGAAWLVSQMTPTKREGWVRLLAAALAGTITVFVFGVLYKALFFGGNLKLAVLTGFIPFAPKACVELILTVSLVMGLRRLKGRPPAVSHEGDV